MKKEDVSEIIGSIDKKYIDEAAGSFTDGGRSSLTGLNANRTGTAGRQLFFRRGLIAACLVLAIVTVTGVVVLAAEAKEYNDAVAFFAENGLPADGLSRSELKAVYRDITQKKFSYGLTAEVIKKAVPGWEIEQEEPTPEDLAAIWDWNIYQKTPSGSGVSFRVEPQYVLDEKLGFSVMDKCILECYRDGEKIWTSEFCDFYVEDAMYSKDRIVVWGFTPTISSNETSYSWLALLDGDGKVLWQKCLSHCSQHESIRSVINNTDGSFAVISEVDYRYLCFSCYGADGEELVFNRTQYEKRVINAARLGDGYILQLRDKLSGDAVELYRMDRNGVLTEKLEFEAEDCVYRIIDMAEYEGHFYLSGYSYQKQNDSVYTRDEISSVLDYVFSEGSEKFNITSEELTPLVRSVYTAVLLRFDPEEGSVESFYSVKGSLGEKLSVTDSGQLEWNVESISSTFLSLNTSSFTIGGKCKVFRYTFDASGTLTGETDTGETVGYAR